MYLLITSLWIQLYKVSVHEVILMKYWLMAIFQESTSKYPSLPNSELLASKMAKLHGLGKYLLWHHNDVIEALNLETNSFYEKFTSKYPQHTKYLLSILKNTKATRPSTSSIMTSLWRHTSLEFKNKYHFWRKQVKITHVIEFWLYAFRNTKVTRPS